MPAKRSQYQSQEIEVPSNLIFPRSEVENSISDQISKGMALLDVNIRSDTELESIRSKYKTWHEFNKELISRLFDGTSILGSYNKSRGSAGTYLINPSLADRIAYVKDGIRECIRRLESIKERLKIIPEKLTEASNHEAIFDVKHVNRKIFIVHGHDAGLKNEVARLLESLELKPIILHEQPNLGQTIIEKFEETVKDVKFAIVLITPDDVCGEQLNDRLTPQPKTRARQNVILELGYFIGKLGRSHVCTLYINGTEIPSDIFGVIYTPVDSGGAWKLKLAKEIKASGIPVDMNKLI
jgi:predicted nucleotide-binding protein